MAKLMKYNHGVKFTSTLIIESEKLSRGYSNADYGKQTFSVSLKKDEQEKNSSTSYELQFSRQEVEETIKKWQSYLDKYPVEV